MEWILHFVLDRLLKQLLLGLIKFVLDIIKRFAKFLWDKFKNLLGRIKRFYKNSVEKRKKQKGKLANKPKNNTEKKENKIDYYTIQLYMSNYLKNIEPLVKYMLDVFESLVDLKEEKDIASEIETAIKNSDGKCLLCSFDKLCSELCCLGEKSKNVLKDINQSYSDFGFNFLTSISNTKYFPDTGEVKLEEYWRKYGCDVLIDIRKDKDFLDKDETNLVKHAKKIEELDLKWIKSFCSSFSTDEGVWVYFQQMTEFKLSKNNLERLEVRRMLVDDGDREKFKDSCKKIIKHWKELENNIREYDKLREKGTVILFYRLVHYCTQERL